MSCLMDLDELDLRDNFLIGALPKDIGNLPALEGLYLYGNNFSGNLTRYCISECAMVIFITS